MTHCEPTPSAYLELRADTASDLSRLNRADHACLTWVTHHGTVVVRGPGVWLAALAIAAAPGGRLVIE